MSHPVGDSPTKEGPMSELPSEHLRLPFEINDRRALILVTTYAGVPLVIGFRGLVVDPATHLPVLRCHQGPWEFGRSPSRTRATAIVQMVSKVP